MEDNIKINPKAIGWEGLYRIHQAQHREVTGLCEHGNDLQVPQKQGIS